MTILFDDMFGVLTFNYGWIGRYPICFLNEDLAIELCISCDEGDAIGQGQREAFLRFDANKDTLISRAEVAIFNHYQSICMERRAQFGVESADEFAPLITEIIQLKSLVHVVTLMIKRSNDIEDRVVALLFDCSWEPELGLAVQFESEIIELVGIQDLVL